MLKPGGPGRASKNLKRDQKKEESEAAKGMSFYWKNPWDKARTDWGGLKTLLRENEEQQRGKRSSATKKKKKWGGNEDCSRRTQTPAARKSQDKRAIKEQSTPKVHKEKLSILQITRKIRTVKQMILRR